MDPAPTPVPASPARAPASPITWPGPAQLALAFLLGAAASLLAVQALGAWHWGGRPSEVAPGQGIPYRIDLNRAERAELLQLPGVGESLAQRIEDHRSRAGGFRSVEELRAVPGIGPATLEQLRGWVRVDAPEIPKGQPVLTLPQTALPPAVQGSKKIADLKEPINVNQATVEELQRLPGIGPKLSQRIVEERLKGPFRSVDDLRRVSGIGPKTVERLRPHVIMDAGPLTVTRID